MSSKSSPDDWWSTRQDIFLSRADLDPPPLFSPSTQSSHVPGNWMLSNDGNGNFAQHVHDQAVNNCVTISSTNAGGGLKRKSQSPMTQGGSKKCNTGTLVFHPRRIVSMDKLFYSKFKSPVRRNVLAHITPPSNNNAAPAVAVDKCHAGHMPTIPTIGMIEDHPTAEFNVDRGDKGQPMTAGSHVSYDDFDTVVKPIDDELETVVEPIDDKRKSFQILSSKYFDSASWCQTKFIYCNKFVQMTLGGRASIPHSL